MIFTEDQIEQILTLTSLTEKFVNELKEEMAKLETKLTELDTRVTALEEEN